MVRIVNYVVLERPVEGRDYAPYPGELGRRIYESV